MGKFYLGSAIGDNDKDGIPDLMVKFKRSDAINVLPLGENVSVHVTGKVGPTSFNGVERSKGTLLLTLRSGFLGDGHEAGKLFNPVREPLQIHPLR